MNKPKTHPDRIYDPLVVKIGTLESRLFDGVSHETTLKFARWAEAVAELGPSTFRYYLKKIEYALEYICQHPSAFHKYATISEAKAAEEPKN